jgi:hypothetical protein
MQMKTGQKLNSEHRRIRVEAIRTDAGTQSRAHISDLVVADYAEAMIRGEKFPPVVVFQNNGDLILASGFHRVKACRAARFISIAAEVRQGTRTDALKYSLQSNHAHGLRRTNDDKRHAVKLALTEFSNLSDRVIANMCAVSQPFVGIVRRELKTVISSETRLGRDGKMRRLPAKQPAKASDPRPQVVVQDSADKQVNAALLKIAESLAGIETAVRRVVSNHPKKKSVVRGFLAKVRSDLANLEKEMASAK